jgi:hypothetical protein
MKAGKPNPEELRKMQEIEHKGYVKEWNEFVAQFIRDHGKVPMPGIVRYFASEVQFELGTLEFFEASDAQKAEAKKQNEETKKNDIQLKPDIII